MKIGVEDFTWRSTGMRDTGFIAQDLYPIYPVAVVKGDNGTDQYVPGVTNTWSIDYGKVTPIIVKAIQDQQKLLGGFTLAGSDLSTLVVDAQNEPIRDAADCTNGKISSGSQILTDLKASVLEKASKEFASPKKYSLISHG